MASHPEPWYPDKHDSGVCTYEMASSQNLGWLDDGSSPQCKEWGPGQHQKFPPPAALPSYVNRALPLPPRPDSNTSSAYNTPDEGIPQLPIPKPQLPEISQEQDDDANSGSGGVFDEDGPALVQPLQLAPTSVPQPQQQPLEIATPQPRYPAHIVLNTQNSDIISPVSAPMSGNATTSQQQYQVSPLSPGASERSFHSAVSESEHAANSIRNSASDAKPTIYAPYGGIHTAHSSGDLAAARLASPHQQVEQINLRYSDPGSPISGAVIHPPTAFPSDPNLRLLVDVPVSKFAAGAPPRPKAPEALFGSPEDSPTGIKLTTTTSAGSAGTAKISFAGPKSEGFTRSRANSKKTVPPPLKLSERPLAEPYVKTPFPAAAAAVPPLQRGHSSPHPPVSRPMQLLKSGEDGGARKRLNRVSSVPGFSFARALRRGSSQSGEETAQQQQQGEMGGAGFGGDEGKASPVPRMKGILARAKQLSLGHGLGLGEARKERRRAEMKKQIRIGEPQV
ncbi:hypothetical protein F4804DRAFT_327016 [Jackrogersella minutella]|nr:hypothetical protein F4804DRAFT_327016 [Jackrogersella minutella]